MATGVDQSNFLFRGEGQGASASQVISKRLIDIADSDSKDMAVNASSLKTFRYTVPAGHTARLHSLSMVVHDASCLPTGWGAAALTNGIFIKAWNSDDEVLVDITDGESIKDMASMSLLSSGPHNFVDLASTATDTFSFCMDIVKVIGEPIVLDSGDYFGATIQDNLSGLIYFQMMVHGVYHVKS